MWFAKWRQWKLRQPRMIPADAVSVQHLQRSIDALAGEFRTYTATTDVKLELYGVLIPKVIVDLTHAIREMTIAQRDLADRMDLALGLTPAKPPDIELVHREAV